MADQSLFGMTDPELVKQLIQAEEARNLVAQSQFTPAQMQNFIQLQAGQQLGKGLGGIVGSLFGVEAVDPRVKRAQQAQSIINEVNASGLDPNTPNYMMEISRLAASRGLPDLAQMAAGKAQDMQKIATEILKNEASAAASFASAAKEKTIAPGQEIVQAAGALGFAIPTDVRNFTTEQWKAIDTKINEQRVAQSAASAAKLNFDDPRGQVEAISTISNQLKPLTTQLTTLDQALSLRRNGKSPFSQSLFEQTVTGAFGDSQKAAAEIRRLVNTGNLGQRVTNTLSMFLSGNIGQATKEDQLESLEAIREYAANQYDMTATPFRGALKEKADQIAPLSATRFTRPKLPPNQQYIPISVVNQYNIKKGQVVKQGNKEFVYNGDGTITITKGQ